MPPVASHDALVAARGKLTVKLVAETRGGVAGDVMASRAAALPQRRGATIAGRTTAAGAGDEIQDRRGPGNHAGHVLRHGSRKRDDKIS